MCGYMIDMAPALTELTSLYLLPEIQSACSNSTFNIVGLSPICWPLIQDDFQVRVDIFQVESLPSQYQNTNLLTLGLHQPS